MFKVNKRDTRTAPSHGSVLLLVKLHVSACSSVFIVNFELVVAAWANE